MNLLLETAFDRLLSRYVRTFGEQPPFTSATAEEVIGHMRRRLAETRAADGFPRAPLLPRAARRAPRAEASPPCR